MKPRGFKGFLPFGLLACSVLISFDGLLCAQQQVIEADKVIEDDLYLFGDEVTIDGEVKGDVVAFGRVIRLNGTVTGDFIAAGQAIVITGRVDDDVRIAGQVLKVHENASIGDDLIGAGFSLEFAETSTIDANLLFAGYQALLGGEIGGGVKVAAANCEIAGHVGGDVDLSVDGGQPGAQAYTAWSPPTVSVPNVPAGVTIREKSRIDGDLNYESREEANIESGAKITGEIKQELPSIQTRSPAKRVLSAVGEYATLLLIGLCILLVAPAWIRCLSDNIRTRPIASLSFGVVALIGVVVLMFIILVMMIALAVVAGLLKLTGLIPVAIILGLTGEAILIVSFWFFVVYLAKIVLSIIAGRWILGFAKPSLAENRFVSLLVGLLLVTLVTSVPYLGPIVSWLAVLFGLGALVLWKFRKNRGQPTTVAKPETANA